MSDEDSTTSTRFKEIKKNKDRVTSNSGLIYLQAS